MFNSFPTYYIFPEFLKQMYLASVLHDCTAQLMSRLAYTCPVILLLEVEPSATKVSPIAQIQKHFSHQEFSSPRLSLVQSQYFQWFPPMHWLFLVCKESWRKTDPEIVVHSAVLVSADASHLNCSQIWSCSQSRLIFGKNFNSLHRNWNYQFPFSSKQRAKMGKTPSAWLIENLPF